MTNDTMPWIIWLDKVLSLSGVSVDDLKPYRERILRWYQAGESCAMAAHDLSFLVREGARQLRIEKTEGSNELRAALRAGLRRK